MASLSFSLPDIMYSVAEEPLLTAAAFVYSHPSVCFLQITSIRHVLLGYGPLKLVGSVSVWIFRRSQGTYNHFGIVFSGTVTYFYTSRPNENGFDSEEGKGKDCFPWHHSRSVSLSSTCCATKWNGVKRLPLHPRKTKTYLRPGRAMPNRVWSDIASLPEPKLIIKDYCNNKRRWMAFLLGCNGKMCAVWMGYTSTCADTSRSPLLLAQPICSQSQQFGQSLPATSSSSKADVWRNRSLARARAPICATQLLSANVQYERDIFHQKDRKQLVLNWERFFGQCHGLEGDRRFWRVKAAVTVFSFSYQLYFF